MPRHWVVEFDTLRLLTERPSLEIIGTLDLSLFIRSLVTLALM